MTTLTCVNPARALPDACAGPRVRRRRRGRVARVGRFVSTVSFKLISTTFTVIALHYRRPLVVTLILTLTLILRRPLLRA